MAATASIRSNVSLADKYAAESGSALMSGIQALVRVPLDQRRLDARRGLDTGAFISGYQGSPLGRLDDELRRAEGELEPWGIVFQPGLNEELAATAVAGTQLLGTLERRRRAGVTGYWFGKNPGLDRAADAIRHANVSGVAPLGGAVAWIGDDPASKSSTVPSSCEPMCRSLLMPLLAPGSVQEVLVLGLHAVALSRHAGLWTGLKIVADVADASMVADVGAGLHAIPHLAQREARMPPVLLPPTNLDAEHDLMTARLARVAEYARLAGLNRIRFEPRATPRLAVLAAGVGYQALVRAIEDLGLDDRGLDRAGVRLVQLGMPWPLDPGDVRRLVGGADTVLVVEDKLPFLEPIVRDALYRRPDAPLVLGKEDADGRPLLSARSALSADDVARALGRVLRGDLLPASARARLELLAAEQTTGHDVALPRRTPYFCSGCPHNTSTRAERDRLVGVGIGCHIMIALDGGGRRGTLVGMPQMGGEGAQWLGLAPFTDDDHFTQNLGDGTFHHSGSLAVRAAVAAGVNVTYRLLFNDAVAMTGGQRPEGKLDVPALTRWLEVEGVKRVVVTTPEPHVYRGLSLSAIAEVRHRDDLQVAAAELAAVEGVTVLIHEDRCATEKRRMRKRGKLEAPAQRVMINERVCEGCGDCGEKATCLSVVPVETEFGRKTQIHQSSCNQDFTCLKGDCPSFLLVTPMDGERPERRIPQVRVALPEPDRIVGRDVLVRMPGVGGTGVVTVSAILQMAAHLDGRHAAGLEQVGLAQKGGPVISDVRIADMPIEGQIRATRAGADVILGFDPLGAAAEETSCVADPERTIAVLNTSSAPTAAMVTDVAAPVAPRELLVGRLRRVTRAEHFLTVDATALAERLLGDHLSANMILVGAAFQHGCLPVSEAALERAIRLNGVAVARTLAAFRWGRAAVAAPGEVDAATKPPDRPAPPPDPRASDLLAERSLDGPAGDLVRARVTELVAYQGPAYARRYRDAVLRVADVERQRTSGGGTAIAEAYARGLFKLMAYKDEYEVARLHLDAAERARVADAFGAGAKVQVLLHPPLLRAMGLQRKLRFGRGIRPVFRMLHAARRLRGTSFDPFGRTEVRRLERTLIGEYQQLVDEALVHLDDSTCTQVAALVALADVIRGYEEVKLRSVETFRVRAKELLAALATEARPALPIVTMKG